MRRSVELVLIVAIATVQCVWWTSVDDARQQTRDARVVTDSAANGGVGAARLRATSPVTLSGVIPRGVVIGPPGASFITLHASPFSSFGTFLDLPRAQRPPPHLS